MMTDKRIRKVIQLSFKNDSLEQELYNYLCERLSPANYIKEILWLFYTEQQNIFYRKNSVPDFFTGIPAPEKNKERVDDEMFDIEAKRDQICI